MRSKYALLKMAMCSPDRSEIEMTEEEVCYFLGMSLPQFWAVFHEHGRALEFCGRPVRLVWWELDAA